MSFKNIIYMPNIVHCLLYEAWYDCVVSTGVSVNCENDDGITPLQIAAAYGHVDIIEFLCKNGASVDKGSNLGWTPLMHASRNGHVSVVSILLAQKTDVNKCNKIGKVTRLLWKLSL